MKTFQKLFIMSIVVITHSCNSQSNESFIKKQQLKGKIIDLDNKEGIPSAKIVISNKDTTIEIISDFEGYFAVNKLSVGSYKVDVLAVGYPPLSKHPIHFKDTIPIVFSLRSTLIIDSLKVNYEGSSIIFKDDSGKIKTLKNKK